MVKLVIHEPFREQNKAPVHRLKKDTEFPVAVMGMRVDNLHITAG